MRLRTLTCLVLVQLYCSSASAVPINIVNVSSMAFGTCVQGDSPKVVSPQTSETATNASFQVTGDPNVAFTVVLPTSPINITTGGGGAGRTLTVSSFQSFPSQSSGVLSPGGAAMVYIGATLSGIAVTQVPGSYTGNFVVTVTY